MVVTFKFTSHDNKSTYTGDFRRSELPFTEDSGNFLLVKVIAIRSIVMMERSAEMMGRNHNFR